MFNQVTILGNAGRDPEMRYTAEGQPVTNLSVAGTSGFGNNKKTVWFKVSFWGKLAEIVNQYVKKGDRVFVQGELYPSEYGSPRIWHTQNGEARTSYEVTANTFRFASSRAEGSSFEAEEDYNEDNIPF